MSRRFRSRTALAVVFAAAVSMQAAPQTAPENQPAPAVRPELRTGTEPDFVVTPAIDLEQLWTDNAEPGLGGRARASLITQVTPSLSITADSARLSGTLLYAPTAYLYSALPRQNHIAQNLNASEHVTLVPEEVFVDLRGYAAEQALAPVSAPPGSVALDRQNLAQSYSFSVAPYLTHRFGDWGTAQFGVALQNTAQDTFTGTLPGSSSSGQRLRTTQETAGFTTGEAFGRVQTGVQLAASQSDGTGAVQGARRASATWQVGYAITHSIQALASVGWEDITYDRLSEFDSTGLHINDLTWSVGTKLQPNPDSSITVLYGHQQGFEALSLDGAYTPTPHTRLFATYGESISTATEQLQNLLAGTTFDAFGHPVSRTTGAPVSLSDGFFGFNSGIYRLRNLVLGASWQQERDDVSVSISRQQRSPISQAGSLSRALSVTTDGTYGSVSWQHDVSEAVTTSLFLQYGKSASRFFGVSQDSDLLAASAGLRYALSETLSANAQYSYSSTALGRIGRAGTPVNEAVNLIMLGVRKSF